MAVPFNNFRFTHLRGRFEIVCCPSLSWWWCDVPKERQKMAGVEMSQTEINYENFQCWQRKINTNKKEKSNEYLSSRFSLPSKPRPFSKGPTFEREKSPDDKCWNISHPFVTNQQLKVPGFFIRISKSTRTPASYLAMQTKVKSGSG